MEQDPLKNTLLIFLAIVALIGISSAQSDDPLAFPFNKLYGQVEVGGPFAGIEFHHSNPLPARISFYYPVANSIDVSTGYWERDQSRPFAFGIKIGTGKKKWIGKEGWRYTLSPHTVTFDNDDSLLSYQIQYEFCLTEPAMVFSLKVKNRTNFPQQVSAYSHLLLALRTCQTYARKDSSVMSYDASREVVTAKFQDADTKFASVFVINAGQRAVKAWTDADDLHATDDGKSMWADSANVSEMSNRSGMKRMRGIAAFEYVKELLPGETMTVVQVIGSAKGDETERKISLLSTNWQKEVESYNDLVRRKSYTETLFHTGDRQVDRSAAWSKAILTTNAHYLNGTVVPMPCPAEYNFFFTHDLLMTNLGAVNFDLDRVRKNLLYVASLAQDSVIPHAYYWRDDGYKTELCTPSNWNHLWFIEVSASYLRHSLDTSTIRQLYSLIQKSLSEVLTQLHDDQLMYAFRPDWWDLGWKEGSRTYITALSIRAVEDYLFIASFIDKENPALIGLEDHALGMRSALVTKLWDDSLNYLINYNGTDKDLHRYMGSLIAPAYRLLDAGKTEKMLATTRKDLLAPEIGIRAVMPADFDQDSVIRYFKIAGDEAGKAYTYINGGVWPHNNAWYALALNSIGKSEEAVSFVKQTMTIDGIAASPNGVPALYEYRYSNQSSPRYGEIDKPSFLWAGGFYLYTMYTLAGLNDNVWNLSLGENRMEFDSVVNVSYSLGKLKNASIKGNGIRLHSFSGDGMEIPSLVIPLDAKVAGNLDVQFGPAAAPYVESVNAVLNSAILDASKKNLECSISSFKGHRTAMNVISQQKPSGVFINGKSFKKFKTVKNPDGTITTSLSFVSTSMETIRLKWK